MKLTKILFFIIISTAPWPIQALTIADYKAMRETEPAILDIYINGVGTGFLWANTFNEMKNLPLHYCQPRNLTLNVGNYKMAINNELKEYPERYKDDLPVEIALIKGLERTFPCGS